MGRETSIAWTDATWNPIRGCSRVSEGCRNCYAESVAARFSGAGLPYEGLTRDGKWTGEVRVVERHVLDPLRWEKPRRIFVNSMSDLFHPNVEDQTIDRVFAVMALAPRHTFQVLTKRPERMRRYFADSQTSNRVGDALAKLSDDCDRKRIRADHPGWSFDPHGVGWEALPNVWLGVSVEDQATADARVPLLLQTPAAVRFISYEPALGPVSWRWMNAFHENAPHTAMNPSGRTDHLDGLRRLDWIIVGGESGPRARPFDVAWARSTVEQCREAGVACFVKQLGANPIIDARFDRSVSGWTRRLDDSHGADTAEWPEDLRVQQFPESHP